MAVLGELLAAYYVKCYIKIFYKFRVITLLY
jgi:hypothetical protein